ncbi:MAG: hypothetical protein GWP08_14095 [Nitrospiraceae bacterium]|nr:hypothetical protein [Nitrospiraceae bacterium]
MKPHWFSCMVVVCLVGLGAVAQSAFDFNAEGVAYYNAGLFMEAVASFERAYEGRPDSKTVRRNLCNARQSAANTLAQAADYARAAEHLELAIAVDPVNASPLVQLASYYLRLNMVYDAIFRLEEAIELEPRNVTAHDLLGDAYYMDNDLPSARIQWEWVEEVDPDRPGLRRKLDKAAREEQTETEHRAWEYRNFRSSSDPAIPKRVLRNVLRILEDARRDIGRKFGNVYPPSKTVVVIYNEKGFADATQVGSHVGALYDGKIRIPLWDKAGQMLDETTLHERLYHEYTHVVVQFLTNGNVPWWLNEGLAETFSRPISDARAELLQRARAEDLLFPLAALDANQLSKLKPAALQLAYAQAQATVSHLVAGARLRRLPAMMSALAEGTAVEDALYANYRYTYESLQKDVLDSLDDNRSRVARN